jgi:hypothetical protein
MSCTGNTALNQESEELPNVTLRVSSSPGATYPFTNPYELPQAVRSHKESRPQQLQKTVLPIAVGIIKLCHGEDRRPSLQSE